MNLSLLELYNLAQQVDLAQTKLNEVETQLVELLCRKRGESTDTYLQAQLDRLDGAKSDLCSLAHNLRPITEWTGGETWKWREPDVTGHHSGRRYYTDDEVAEFYKTRPHLRPSGSPPADSSLPGQTSSPGSTD